MDKQTEKLGCHYMPPFGNRKKSSFICNTSNVTHERKIVSFNMPTTELTKGGQGDRWTEEL